MRWVHLLALVLLAGCAPSLPPGPPVPRIATEVPAPFGKTWDAVIDEFAAQNIPIRTMERASGFIATEHLAVPRVAGVRYADCGTDMGSERHPNLATYNVLVRGDSLRSTVKATVRWTAGIGMMVNAGECSTAGAWETAFEAGVRARATGETPVVVADTVRTAVADTSTIPRFVGDVIRQIYYRIDPACRAAEAVSRYDRVFFRTEEDAKLAGMRRSLTQGC